MSGELILTESVESIIIHSIYSKLHGLVLLIGLQRQPCCEAGVRHCRACFAVSSAEMCADQFMDLSCRYVNESNRNESALRSFYSTDYRYPYITSLYVYVSEQLNVLVYHSLYICCCALYVH